MKTRINNSALFAVLLAATASVAIIMTTLRGESRETPFDGICATAPWPLIPAHCLEGSNRTSVRVVDADLHAAEAEADAEQEELLYRFEGAFSD